MSRNSLSVALCTYNGSQYLQDQLGSIAAQTRCPDELVIVDDCSTDNTVNIVTNFKRKASYPVHLIINEINLGVTQNFAKAISCCSGEIIVLSDQDDVWHPEKLQRIMAEFSKSNRIGLVFSDAELVDEDLRSLRCCLWERVGFNHAKQLQAIRSNLFKMLLTKNYVTGATLAFRSHFRDEILPMPDSFVHDAWIALIISALTEVAIIPEPLIKYRQHPNNQIGAVKTSFQQRLHEALKREANTYLRQSENYELLLERLRSKSDSSLLEIKINELQAKINHLYIRAQMRSRPLYRYALAFQELVRLRYHHFSNGWTSFAKDILF